MSIEKEVRQIETSDNIIKVFSPDIVELNLGSCIGLAIMDRESKSAYVSHVYGHELDLIKKTIETAKQDYQNHSSLEVVVSGLNKDSITAEYTEGYNESNDDYWEKVCEILLSSFDEKQIRMERKEGYDDISIMNVDCSKMKIEVKYEDMLDY